MGKATGPTLDRYLANRAEEVDPFAVRGDGSAFGIFGATSPERFMADWHGDVPTREIPLTDLRKIAAAWRDSGF